MRDSALDRILSEEQSVLPPCASAMTDILLLSCVDLSDIIQGIYSIGDRL